MSKEETQAFTPSFSLLRPSARALYLNIWTFVGLYAITMIVSIISNFADQQSSLYLMLSLLGMVIGVVIAPAVPLAQLRSVEGKEVELIEALQDGIPFVFRIFLLQVATIVLFIGGLVLLIVPGIFVIQRLLLAPYFLIDRDLGVIEAIKMSWAETKAHSGPVWGLIGANIAYALLLFTIILIPVAIAILIAYSVAPAIRYKELIKASVKTKA
jgi:hypothetical protein